MKTNAELVRKTHRNHDSSPARRPDSRLPDLRSTVIKGGRIVTACDEFVADLLITGEKISLIGESLDVPHAKVISAEGCYVLPGCIDPHTHVDSPYAGITTCDDLSSATIAAAFGGTTTILDFCLQEPGERLFDAYVNWRKRLERNEALIDFGFHMTVTDLSVDDAESDIARLCEVGVTSLKLYFAPGPIGVDDRTAFETMRLAARHGALCMVHGENGGVIEALTDHARSAGQSDPIWHALTRPRVTEENGTTRAIHLAELAGAPLYMVHVSCAEATAAIARARASGRRVWGETCTQYLFIDEDHLRQPNFEGAKYVFTPPPRSRDDIEQLWRDLRTDTLSVVATDHCPYNWQGQKTEGIADFSKIPGGAPGVEERLVMVYQGVREGRLTMSRLVALLSTNPARLFGLYPRKGSLVPGADADLVVFNPELTRTLSKETHHSKIDYNLYEGRTVVGAPEVVLSRGQLIVEGEELVAQSRAGSYLHRGAFH